MTPLDLTAPWKCRPFALRRSASHASMMRIWREPHGRSPTSQKTAFAAMRLRRFCSCYLPCARIRWSARTSRLNAGCPGKRGRSARPGIAVVLVIVPPPAVLRRVRSTRVCRTVVDALLNSGSSGDQQAQPISRPPPLRATSRRLHSDNRPSDPLSQPQPGALVELRVVHLPGDFLVDLALDLLVGVGCQVLLQGSQALAGGGVVE